MDCAEVKGQIPKEEQLEPLVILEEGDELDDFTHSSTRGKGILRLKKEDMEDRIKRDTGGSIDSKNDVEEEGESTHMTIAQGKEESQQKEGLEYKNQTLQGGTEAEESTEVKRVQAGPWLLMEKAGGEMDESKTDPVPKGESHADTQPPAKLRPRDLLSPEVAQQKVTFYISS